MILDTGPLVAALNAKDRWHSWVAERLDEIEPPLLTCEAVLSEACFLLRLTPGGPAAVLELLKSGTLALPLRLVEHTGSVRRLVKRYDNVPMSLADACLVRMAEIEDQGSVLTFDSDFRVYRKHGRQAIPLLMPDRR